MIYAILTILAIAIVAANVYLHQRRHTTRFQRREEDSRMTRTGETIGERSAYHERGEFSPGEHAAARALGERLKEIGWISDTPPTE